MHFLIVLISVYNFLATDTDALYLVKKQKFTSALSSSISWNGEGGPGGSASGLSRRAPVENLTPQREREFSIVVLDILRNAGIYTARLPVGERQKSILFQVSTSLSDIVIHSEKTLYVRPNIDPFQDKEPWCKVVLESCSRWGTADTGSIIPYDPSVEFELDLGDQKKVLASLWLDTVTIGVTVIPNAPIGVALLSNLDTNILGLGLKDNEAARTLYPNLPQVIKEDKLTKINAYSVWLHKKGDSDSERAGQIVFGGYDRAKHTGRFAHLNMLPIQGKFKESFVPVKSVSFGSTTRKRSLTLDVEAKKAPLTASFDAAILDVGTAVTMLPPDFAEAVANAVGATMDDSHHYIIDCALSDEVARMYMVFDFGLVKIKLLAEDIVLPRTVSGAPAGKCMWGVFPAIDQPVLGNNFLRRAYVVFDLDHRIVSVANTAYTGTSEVHEIPEGGLRKIRADLLGLGDLDPDLERIAGDMEPGDETAGNSDGMRGNAISDAFNTGTDASDSSKAVDGTRRTLGEVVGTSSNAVGMEPTSNVQTSPGMTNNLLGTLETGTQLTPASDASLVNSDESSKLATSFVPETEPSAEKVAGGFPLNSAFKPNPDSPTSTPTIAKNLNNNEKPSTWQYSTTSYLFPPFPLTPTDGGTGTGSDSALTNPSNSYHVSLPAVNEASLSDNSQALGVNLASALAPGAGGAGVENLFTDPITT
ncbi:hypothetical protein MMC07_001490 [Pseudocyphellaria aurata]|nr:hypothetical protein [Pseudocyphellaria aurata]